jgi:hypothetical protein
MPTGGNGLKSYLRIGLAFVVIGGLALWFSPVEERPMLLSGFAVAIGMFIAISTPAIRGFVATNARLTYGMGAAALLVALVLIFAPFASSAIPTDTSITASSVLMLVGILALVMPRIVKRYATDVAAAKLEQALPKTGFDAVAELRAVFGELARNQPALIRIVGPWLVIDMIAFLPLAYVRDAAAHLNGDRALATKFLFGILGLLLVHLFLLWTALIKWVRFAASQGEMRLLDIPWRSLWGWAWRWFIYSTIFKALHEVGPFLHRQLPAASSVQLDGLEAVTGFAVTVLFSPYCLAFIAVALGAADRSWFAATRGFRIVGRKYFIGVALILAPNALVNWGLGVVDVRVASPGAIAASLTIASVMTFATMIVGATYCARVYLRGAEAGATIAIKPERTAT